MDEELEMDYIELRRLRRKRISSCVKSAATFLFSHVGLAAMVIGYSIMGGFLFKALEAPNESKEKLRIRSFKEGKIAEIKQLADLLCVKGISAENFTDFVSDIQLQFQQQVTLAVKNNGWDGKDDTDETTLQWSFAGSLLYAVTVITTIGYGHVAPKTTAGRLVTILYALVGIPLTFLYLSNMGNFMAECFRLFYKKICCGICIYFMSTEDPKDLDEEKDAQERMEMSAQRNFAFLNVEEEEEEGAEEVVKKEEGTADDNRGKKVVILCPDSGDVVTPHDSRGHSPNRRTTVRHQDHRLGRINTNPDQLDSSGLEDGVGGGENHSGHTTAHQTTDEQSLRVGGAAEKTRRRSEETNTASKIKDSLRNLGLFSSGDSVTNRKMRIEPSGKSGRSGTDLQRRQSVKRRLSLESGIDLQDVVTMRRSTNRPLMIDKSIETSAPELSSRDPDALTTALTTVSRSTLHCIPSRSSRSSGGAGAAPLSNGGNSRKSSADLRFNSTATDAPFPDGKEHIPLRRLSSRSKALHSEQSNEEDSTVDSKAQYHLESESEKRFSEPDCERRDSEDEHQRLMYSRMMARRSLQARSTDSMDDEQVTVPISICLIIIGVYIFTGSMLFTLWEDWDYLTGSYFCFVTLSTIGFGDIVPGTDMKEWAAHQKLILCSLWLVVGLSLLAMCFNLMQEEVKDWCKWVGHKLGILKD